MLIHLKQVYGFPKHGYSMDDRVPMGELVVVPPGSAARHEGTAYPPDEEWTVGTIYHGN